MAEYRLTRVDPPGPPHDVDDMVDELMAELDGPLETDCAAPTDVADMTWYDITIEFCEKEPDDG